MRSKFIYIIFLFPSLLAAQIPLDGNLPIKNYSKKTYNSGTQNWDIAVAENDIIYFANNDGLLIFDGSHWDNYPIANLTNVRSVALLEEKVYVGGQGDFGYFAPQSSGELKYSSLLSKVPQANRNFADVWDIEIVDKVIFYRTERYMFRLKNDKIDVFDAGSPILFMGKINDHIYIHTKNNGLLKFEENSFVLQDFGIKPKSPITAFLPYQQGAWLITTLKDGIFLFDGNKLTPFKTTVDTFIKENSIYSATALPNKTYALGINSKGVLFIDNTGKTLRFISKKEGLQNLGTLAIHADNSGNLWLGLDNGIDYIEVNSPFTFIYPDSDSEGTGYAASVSDSILFLGNSNGLYTTKLSEAPSPFKKETFIKSSFSDNQVWGLKAIDEQVLAGLHSGAYQVSGASFEKLPNIEGVWDFIQINKDYLLIGHYLGIKIFRKEGQNWKYYRDVEKLEESSRILVKENTHTVWMSHPYRGVYKIEFTKDFSSEKVVKYAKEKGLASDNFNHVFKVQNEIIVGGKKHIYRYEKDKDTFQPSIKYNNLIGKYGRLKLLKEDPYGNLWFVAGKVCGQLKIESKQQKTVVKELLFSELFESLVAGFESVYSLDKNTALFGAEKGFIQLNTEKHLQQSKGDLNVRIKSISVNDSLIHIGHTKPVPSQIAALSSSENRITFKFSANDFRSASPTLFRTKQIGLSSKWTDWSKQTQKEYAGLSSGEYTFWVQAKTGSGIESAPLSFHFKIKAPLYLSKTALASYALLLLSGIFLALRRQARRHQDEKSGLEETIIEKEKILQEQTAAGKLEISKIKQQKLEAEVKYKNQELATAALNLLQKREMLNDVKNELKRILKNNETKNDNTREISKLIRRLDQSSKDNQEWEQFAYHFDQVHQGFLSTIKEKHPNLSPTDLKLCAYLRMNLSSKEIAPLMAISVRSVEAARYRLRKKLKLDSSVKLREIMMRY